MVLQLLTHLGDSKITTKRVHEITLMSVINNIQL